MAVQGRLFKRNITMCTVTEEMVLRANDRLATSMREGLHRSSVASDGIFVPVSVFGMTVYRKMPMTRVNEIYGEARKKVMSAYGAKV